MSEEAKAGREIRNPGFSVKRFRNLYFADGLFELFVFLPFWCYIAAKSALTIGDTYNFVFCAIMAVVLLLSLGFGVYAMQSRRRRELKVGPSSVIRQIIFVGFVLGLYAYFEYSVVLDLPYISAIFLFVIWGTLAYLTRLPRFYLYLGWILFSFFVIKYMAAQAGPISSTDYQFLYGSLTGSIPVIIGLITLVNYVKHPKTFTSPMARTGLSEADGLMDESLKEDTPGIEDFLKANELIKKGRSSYFEDGIFELFFGLLFSLVGVKQFIELYHEEYLQGFTTAFYTVMIIALILMGIWNVRKYKILGTTMPGFEMIIGPVVFMAAVLMGDILGGIYITALVWFLLFIAGAYWMKLKRYFIYAAWTVVSYLAAVLGKSVFFSYEVGFSDLTNGYIIAFSVMLIILGSITAVGFNAKHLSSRANYDESAVSNTNGVEVG